MQVPTISISFAPPQEPSSPYAVNDDALTPPLLVTQHQKQHRGLDTDQFQLLLNAARDRSQQRANGNKNAHHHQQHRRALFLSKLNAPPSPTATHTPATPPRSPSVFHYSLPSPGLDSPLGIFESVDKSACESWVEKVYFNDEQQPEQQQQKSSPLGLPSLEQISARLIPSSSSSSSSSTTSSASSSRSSSPSRPQIGVGRLKMPLRSPNPSPTVRMTTVVQPPPTHRSSSSFSESTSNLTESNLSLFNIRGQRAHDMLCTLRRRIPPNSLYCHPHLDDHVSRFKRYSAPAELPSNPRIGFIHPVLALPGSF